MVDMNQISQRLSIRLKHIERTLRNSSRISTILDAVDAGDEAPEVVSNRIKMAKDFNSPGCEKESIFYKYNKQNPGVIDKYVQDVMNADPDNVVDLFG